MPSPTFFHWTPVSFCAKTAQESAEASTTRMSRLALFGIGGPSHCVRDGLASVADGHTIAFHIEELAVVTIGAANCDMAPMTSNA